MNPENPQRGAGGYSTSDSGCGSPAFRRKWEEMMSRHFCTQQERDFTEPKAGGKAAKGISITTEPRD